MQRWELGTVGHFGLAVSDPKRGYRWELSALGAAAQGSDAERRG